MDVLEAIMKIFADIFALNNIPGTTSDLMINVMSSFVQGIMALVQTIENIYEVLGTV